MDEKMGQTQFPPRSADKIYCENIKLRSLENSAELIKELRAKNPDAYLEQLVLLGLGKF